MTQIIVGLHGKPRTGKDTIARALVTARGFRSHGFADALYAEVAAMFGVTVEYLQKHETKTIPQDRLAVIHCENPDFRDFMRKKGVDYFAPHTTRQIMQQYGTDFTHRDNPLKWVNIVEGKMRQAPGANFVITDVRFPRTELEMLRRFARGTGRAFILLEVTRPDTGIFDSAHVSDNVFHPALINAVITNDADMNSLHARVMYQITQTLKEYDDANH